MWPRGYKFNYLLESFCKLVISQCVRLWGSKDTVECYNNSSYDARMHRMGFQLDIGNREVVTQGD